MSIPRARAAERTGALLVLLILCLPAPAAMAAITPDSPGPASAVSSGRSGTSLSSGLKIIPRSGPDLELLEKPAIYAGDQLYDYIDGGAPQYMEYGFLEVASQQLKYRGHTYVYDVYKMADPLAAFGIFSSRRSGSGQSIEGFPHSSFTPYQGLVAEGPYLIELIAYENSAETRGEMASLIRLGLGPQDSLQGTEDLLRRPPFTALPREGLLPGTERLARGRVSLRAALGPEVPESFLRMVDSVQASISPGLHPVWLVAGYHGKPDSTEGEGLPLKPATTLVLLSEGGAPDTLLAALRRSDLWPAGTAELQGFPGSLVAGTDGGCWMVRVLGEELALAFSRLGTEEFRGWGRALGPR